MLILKKKVEKMFGQNCKKKARGTPCLFLCLAIFFICEVVTIEIYRGILKVTKNVACCFIIRLNAPKMRM